MQFLPAYAPLRQAKIALGNAPNRIWRRSTYEKRLLGRSFLLASLSLRTAKTIRQESPVQEWVTPHVAGLLTPPVFIYPAFFGVNPLFGYLGAGGTGIGLSLISLAR